MSEPTPLTAEERLAAHVRTPEGPDDYCTGCGGLWPCDVALALDAARSAPSLDVDAFLHSLTERPELSPDWREGIEYARLSLAAEYARIKEQP